MPQEAQGPATTKIQLALKVWPVTGGQTFSVDLLLSPVRPLGLPGLRARSWWRGSTTVYRCRLRIEKALAVETADFRDNGTILRMYQQATRDGRETAPLKKRKRGEYRDIPVPRWLWDMIRDLPDGPLMIGNGERRYHL